MSKPTPISRLLGLPSDIQKLIMAALDVRRPLFAPIYQTPEEKSFVYGNLTAKHEEYYGTQTDHTLSSSQALLNWSGTCHFYRGLLGPRSFQDVILRPRFKSMASLKHLSTTPHWQHIQSLTFVGTFMPEERAPSPNRQVTNYTDPLEHLDYEALSGLLSHLPPNLSQLTLDFPTDWIQETRGSYLDLFHVDETPERTLELETTDTWRKLIFTVFDSLARNDMSYKESFELKLLNIPPLPCSVYWSEEFRKLLHHVTDIKLGFCHFDSGAGWQLNTMDMPANFTSELGNWFWNHLANIRRLQIHADSSWPIGLAPGRCLIPLALPDPSVRFLQLKTLDLRWWFIDHELINLLTKHMPKLEELSIEHYYADDQSNSTGAMPSWADFFDALSKHKHLREVVFGASRRVGLRLLDPYEDVKEPLTIDNSEESFRDAWYAVKALQAQRMESTNAGTWTEKQDLRMKRVWPHCRLDEKYGFVSDAEEHNVERFTGGEDHEAWMRLCDVLERRGGGCRVVEAEVGTWDD